ncbi:MAG: hypothetical protein WCK86_18905, partial [Planctomycetia bacterium]
QEVQFRFDNGIWNGHSRKRGVELTVENLTPLKMKNTINNHYNGSFLEPWGERSQRGYGIEVIDRFAREVAFVEYGGSAADRTTRLHEIRALGYADLSADRQVVAAVEAMERILEAQAAGQPDRVARSMVTWWNCSKRAAGLLGRWSCCRRQQVANVRLPDQARAAETPEFPNSGVSFFGSRSSR